MIFVDSDVVWSMCESLGIDLGLVHDRAIAKRKDISGCSDEKQPKGDEKCTVKQPESLFQTQKLSPMGIMVAVRHESCFYGCQWK